MKIEKNVRIKKNITIYDLANVIDTIVPFIIRKDEDGITYTPYFKELGVKIGIAKYLIEGIEFEEDDDILDEITNNKKLSELIDSFFVVNVINYEFIMDNVKDIVDLKKKEFTTPDFSDIKERLLKSIEQEQALNSLSIKLAKKQNTLLSQQIRANEYQEKMMESMTPEESTELNKKLLSGEFDFNKIAEIAVQKYLDSEIHRGKEKELIEAQADKIADLSKYKAMHDARNVLSSDRGGTNGNV